MIVTVADERSEARSALYSARRRLSKSTASYDHGSPFVKLMVGINVKKVNLKNIDIFGYGQHCQC